MRAAAATKGTSTMAKRVKVTVEPNKPDGAPDFEQRYGAFHNAPEFVARCNACPWTAGADTQEDAEGAAEDHKAFHRAETKQNTAK